MYKTALRQKLRFQTTKGQVSIEDLWDMPLTSKNGFDLDTVAKSLNKSVKESAEESFVKPVTTSNAADTLRFNIVKDVIADKLADLQASQDKEAKAERKKQLLAALHTKQAEATSSKSIEELEAELAAL